MKKINTFILIFLVIYSCFSSKSHSKALAHNTANNSINPSELVNFAKQYLGTKHKMGGTTTAGMDCSGLVYTTYKNQGKSLPRSSFEMSKQGEEISIKNIKIGDLLFFNIARRGSAINHVGMVTSIDNGTVMFIHSTTKRGVIISSLTEAYWDDAFVEAREMM